MAKLSVNFDHISLDAAGYIISRIQEITNPDLVADIWIDNNEEDTNTAVTYGGLGLVDNQDE